MINVDDLCPAARLSSVFTSTCLYTMSLVGSSAEFPNRFINPPSHFREWVQDVLPRCIAGIFLTADLADRCADVTTMSHFAGRAIAVIEASITSQRKDAVMRNTI